MPRDDGPELRQVATLVALHGMLMNQAPNSLEVPGAYAKTALDIGRWVAEGLEPTPADSETYQARRLRFGALFFARLDPATQEKVRGPWKEACKEAEFEFFPHLNPHRTAP